MNYLLRRGGNHAVFELDSLEILKQFHEQRNVCLQPDPPAGLPKMPAADTPVFRIVKQ